MDLAEHGTVERYRAGCACRPCFRAYKAAAQHASWLRLRAQDPESRRRFANLDESDATHCSCGGLLAEDDDGRLWCLSCDEIPEAA